MSSELEQRLEGFFRELPEPEPGVGESAAARAAAAIRPVAPAHRGLRAGALALAAAVVLLAIAAGSLAAAGALHVHFGAQKKTSGATHTPRLPSGSDGIAVVEDGYLSVVTKSGFRLQGLPVNAAALSPHALYVAAGVGHSLVAMAPNGKRAWSHPVGGPVVQIAWAPDGFRIAYIVRIGRRAVLHVIWGNGLHDTVIDHSVRAVRPSWRADSLAVAYVGGGGAPGVYDLAHESRSLVAVHGPATGVAFAPAGDSLAVAQESGIWLLHQSAATHIPGHVEAFGWLGGQLADVVPGLHAGLIRFYAPSGASRGSQPVRGIVVAVTPKLVVVERNWQLIGGDTVLLTLTPETVPDVVEIR
ncbi:MAG: hypothetical protein ACRDLM_05415 [Gaiellaceae bacterium]